MANILSILFYDQLLPPRNGGQLRCFNLLRELGRANRVHVVVLQSELDLAAHNRDEFPKSIKFYSPIQVPPPRTIFDLLPPKLGRALQYRWLRRSLKGSCQSGFVKTHHLIHQILRNECIDAAIFAGLAAMTAAPLVRRLSPRTVRILDADNVEHKLVPLGGDFRSLLHTESRLYEHVHAFFACSDDDRETLETLNRGKLKGFTVANGVDTKIRPFDDRATKANSREVLFCGTLSYRPNQRGLDWFHGSVWPKITARYPGARFLVIGRGSSSDDFKALRTDATVNFIGEVDDVVPFYRRAWAVVVPLLDGSGTRLKILEAMSLGNPVVSTPVGAAGLTLAPEKHILLRADAESFAEAVCNLLNDATRFNSVRAAARNYVEKTYDWTLIGEKLNEVIKHLTSASANASSSREEVNLGVRRNWESATRAQDLSRD